MKARAYGKPKVGILVRPSLVSKGAIYDAVQDPLAGSPGPRRYFSMLERRSADVSRDRGILVTNQSMCAWPGLRSLHGTVLGRRASRTAQDKAARRAGHG